MPTGGKSTLTQLLIEHRRLHPDATGDLNALITDVSLACKAIACKVAYGGLAGMLGSAGSSNVQGEEQKTLDVLSNALFIRATEWGGHVAGLVSEEMETPYVLPPQHPRGKYLLLVDPLDGSSNIDVNVAVGSIFSVLRAATPGQDPQPQDFLQPGTRQVCAGYAIYGNGVWRWRCLAAACCCSSPGWQWANTWHRASSSLPTSVKRWLATTI